MQKWKNQPIARPIVEHCHWFILPLLLLTPTMEFSLDRKRQSHKRKECMVFITADILNSARFDSILFCENFEINFNSFPLGLWCSQIFTSQNG